MTDEADGLDGRVRSDIPHSARIWNFWLGGKDNFECDREMGDQIRAVMPGIVDTARADRLFLGRAVRYLAAEAGVRQFLDIGTGLPTADNTHEVAQRLVPAARIVYVDNDPLVLVHARALLTSSPEGATSYIDADLNDPAAIVREAAKTLDFREPVAVMMLGILHFILDDQEARQIVARLAGAAPPGSHVVISHASDAAYGAATRKAADMWNEHGTPKMCLRSPEQIEVLFEGLDLLEPGVLSVSRWRPDVKPFGEPDEVDYFGGVARKP